jgi:Ca2+-binding EF-hand superfamily protein
VEQLFTSLDEDFDGKIDLNDFLQLFLGTSSNAIFAQKSKPPLNHNNNNISYCPSNEVSQ